MNYAESVPPLSATALAPAIAEVAKLPPNRATRAGAIPVEAGADAAPHAHEHEEAGCVCRNCAGKGDCGRNR